MTIARMLIVASVPAFAAGVGAQEGTKTMQGGLRQSEEWAGKHFAKAKTPQRSTVAKSGALEVIENFGAVQRDSRDGRPLRIREATFKKGLFCHAVSRIRVHLPAPGARFTATVGGETNGDYTGGSMVFVVSSEGKERYRSKKMLRGEPGEPVSVDLEGALSFEIAVENAGDDVNSDQACWGDAKVRMADGKSIWVSDLAEPARRSAAVLPFSFLFGGASSDDLLPQWRYVKLPTVSEAGKTKDADLYIDPKSGLEVRFERVRYAGYPVAEWTVRFKNGGKKNTPIISEIRALDVALGVRKGKAPLLHHFIGSPCAPNDFQPLETVFKPNQALTIATSGGRPTDAALPYFNVETGKNEGVIAAVSWAGQWSSDFTRQGGNLRVRGGQELTHFTLRPGEEVRSPVAVLLFYKGDWIDGQNVWRRWMIAHNLPKRNGKPLTPLTSLCMGNSYPGIITDAAGELAYLKAYVDAGVKLDFWWQDAGWYKCGDPPAWTNTGTWEVEPNRWPNGIRGVSDWCKPHGIETLVWFEPERVAGGYWIAENKPEWVLGGKDGGLLNLGIPECREWLTDKIDSVLKEQGIHFYRQDFNIAPLPYWRANDAPDRQGITEIKHVEGYFAFWDELKRRNNGMLIDSCASGGRRNDLETLRRALPMLRSDFLFQPLAEQCHTYGISFWMPFNGTGFLEPDPYLVRSQMSPEFTIGVQPKGIPALKPLLAQWREVSPCYFGDYYPLTPYSLVEDVWMAWQFNLPEKGRGFFQAFRRAECASESLVLKLRGLDPKATYEVVDFDHPTPIRVTGKELMAGYEVESLAKAAALVFKYRKV